MDTLSTSVLYVCLGNICRSPAAEGITKKMIAERGISDKLFVDSAGIGDWHVGQLPDSRMRKHGKLHGYDFCSRARQIKTEDFERFDYIITMDKDNYSYLCAVAPDEGARKKVLKMADYLRHHKTDVIPDPYYGNDKDFELVIDLLEDACEGLLDSLHV